MINPENTINIATDPQYVVLIGMIITGLTTIIGALLGSWSMVKKSMLEVETARKLAAQTAEAHTHDLLANTQTRDASTSEVMSNTLKTALESLRKDIELRDLQRVRERADEDRRRAEMERKIDELSVKLQEREQARLKEREEEMNIRNDLTIKIDHLTARLEDALTGIDILTKQLEKENITPHYPRG